MHTELPYIGLNPMQKGPSTSSGRFIRLDQELFYEITEVDSMHPFFISLASDSDHWMYIASTGGLTAGRKNPDQALFPYYTDDKITESAEYTGSKTIFLVEKNGKRYLWEPFSIRNQGLYRTERRLAKSCTGNQLRFTETNLDLGLTFHYTWMNSDAYGWIKRSELCNLNEYDTSIYLVDGLQNILPAGIDRLTQNTFSTLVDGYKKSERAGNLGLFRMEAILVDRAEPSEALRANTVWCCGLENPVFLLSSVQLDAIRRGIPASDETFSKGVRGAFFACTNLTINAKKSSKWYFAAEVNQDASAINNLLVSLSETSDPAFLLEESVRQGTENLRRLVAGADGIQQTANEHLDIRHYSNVLFNCMRGGVFENEYLINSPDFEKHVKIFNTNLAATYQSFFKQLAPRINYHQLKEEIEKTGDPQLTRLFFEFLPLTFSRRHGDPSRPWNLFSIDLKDEKGRRRLSYQGNWRDIFQNWEALSVSYPGYLTGMISKFLNASTVDGYNPYKLSEKGIEWEVIEPENPWSNIGYWGDHQIIYLLRLLEMAEKHEPGWMLNRINRPVFAYAQVPYRLKNYKEIVANPKDSIRFDDELHRIIGLGVSVSGADARLVHRSSGEVLLVTLFEKLLVTLLTKLSNFIPEAGIWMNTLRPEWNDANNALVGTGASMVTLSYLRRFVAFFRANLQKNTDQELTIRTEVAGFFNAVDSAFQQHKTYIVAGWDDHSRRSMTNALGEAGSHYRQEAYRGFSGQTTTLSSKTFVEFLNRINACLDQSIRTSQRPDKLYHSYNLVSFSDSALQIRPLYEMLEGQVAVLSSGCLSPAEALNLLDSLRKSALYRADQNSYILYPNKILPGFLEKNNVSAEAIERIPWLQKQVKNNSGQIIRTDRKGLFHFHPDFKNVNDLLLALNQSKGTGKPTAEDIASVCALYENTFDHQSFTGRSGSFYKYEGLGCIYWHMVSKLLLAIGECIQQALEGNEEKSVYEGLRKHYFSVRDGIGAGKSPADYGAFPFDPYSHTPTMYGVQQPGMTGQVKEDIINRFFELGIQAHQGIIRISPELVSQHDFRDADASNDVPYLRFTYCGRIFEYRQDGKTGCEIHFANGQTECLSGYTLNPALSQALFNRDQSILNVVVHFPKPS